jgi:Ser/Thr protein kinase RdoA (MazF antagonist)
MEEVSLIATKHYHLSVSSVESLPSYSDRNYYFRGEDEREFILNLSNPLSTSYEAIVGIVGLMKHLHSQGFPVPHPLPSHTGGHVIQLSRAELKKDVDNAAQLEPSRADLKKDGEKNTEYQLSMRKDSVSDKNTSIVELGKDSDQNTIRRGNDNVLTRAELKDAENAMKYAVYVLSYIPGKIFDHVDKQCLTPALLHEIGELLGKIDKELMVSACMYY